MQRRKRADCPHGWVEPGDGWAEKSTYAKGKEQYRAMRCRLCGEGRIEKRTAGGWTPIDQLLFNWGQ